MKSLYLWLGIVVLAAQALGCTAPASNNGVCARSCGSRPVGGGNLRGIALTPGVAFSKCKAGDSLPQQTFHFLIYDDTSTKTTSAESTSTPGGDIPSRIPKAGIAFTPVVPGYNTVDSPTSDWCTDSCGIAEIKFTPTCAEQDISVGVIVPGMVFDENNTTIPSTKFSVSLE